MQAKGIPGFRIFAFSAILLVAQFAAAQHYTQTNLVSDIPGLAAKTDADLVNPWGMSRSATSPFWVSDAGVGVSTLYSGDGTKQSLRVTIPGIGTSPSVPTGQAFNGGTGFPVGSPASPARFIFATIQGTIAGWTNSLGTTAQTKIDNSGKAVYTGMTLATLNSATMLYAADFKGAKVDVFDSNWQPATVPGGFVDMSVPAGFAPFNVLNVGGNVFVMFAQQGAPPNNFGKGLGYVDMFDSGGHLLQRLQHGPWMNAPWGVAQAPEGFGEFSGDILVGMFGSGQIAAFDPGSGEYEGFLHGDRGPLVIERLWSIVFGGGAPNNGSVTTLFFTAGIESEHHGLLGTLTPKVDQDDNDKQETENDDRQDQKPNPSNPSKHHG